MPLLNNKRIAAVAAATGFAGLLYLFYNRATNFEEQYDAPEYAHDAFDGISEDSAARASFKVMNDHIQKGDFGNAISIALKDSFLRHHEKYFEDVITSLMKKDDGFVLKFEEAMKNSGLQEALNKAFDGFNKEHGEEIVEKVTKSTSPIYTQFANLTEVVANMTEGVMQAVDEMMAGMEQAHEAAAKMFKGVSHMTPMSLRPFSATAVQQTPIKEL